MRDFIFQNRERFLEIADQITTPFKFYQVTEFGNKVLVEAKVWLRTAYISYAREFNLKNEDEADEWRKLMEELENHGFSHVEIKETAYPIK